MSSMEIISKIEALKEWEKLAAEAAAEIEALKDSIKAEINARNLEELAALAKLTDTGLAPQGAGT